MRYLEMIEAGTKTPTLHVLHAIAKVLGGTHGRAFSEAPSEDHEGPVNPRLAELERALITYRTVSLNGGSELPSLEELASRIKTTHRMCG